ncbi:MAG: type II secretion system protein GspE [Acidimicrobiia bacterium]|nr:type II secretion system protein GspE [Acidimicrobiia bacterium]
MTSANARAELARTLGDTGLVSADHLGEPADEARGTHQALLAAVLASEVVPAPPVVQVVAPLAGVEFVDLAEQRPEPGLLGLLAPHIARRYQAVPVRRDAGRLVVGMVDPSDLEAVDDLRAVLGEGFSRVLVGPDQLTEVLDEASKLDEEVQSVAQIVVDDSAEAQPDLAGLQAVVEEAPIVKFVNLIILQAVQERASDIHVEPTEHDLRIRFRIDGVLHERTRQPRSIVAGVVSRLKVMAEIDISERRVPQDGRIGVSADGKTVDLRVSTLPTVYGEKVVMRILDRASGVGSLADLGFLPNQLARYRSAYERPYGATLVTGPTGSGKSTTLYATLNQLNDPARNIVTVEDPVEYRLANINQVQTNPKAGLSFAKALRSILRQDPDIVLIGEIRDRETGVIAIEAALTGHLVLSTLHTNDAPSTPLRLLEMGIEPFLVTSALDCVLAQRLARQLCDRCKGPRPVTAAELAAAGWDEGVLGAPPQQVLTAVGCQACGRTGYRGRLAVHEVMLVSEQIKRLIVERASSDVVRRLAISEGMTTLRIDALTKVAMGRTTLEEVFRVVA